MCYNWNDRVMQTSTVMVFLYLKEFVLNKMFLVLVFCVLVACVNGMFRLSVALLSIMQCRRLIKIYL